MITRKLSKLNAAATAMPKGYLDDVLSGATIDRDAGTYTVSEEHWAAMVQKYRPRGLGDVVARGAAMLGVKPCGGCKKRQAVLNRAVPFE